MAETDSGWSADRRSENAVKLVSVLVEAAGKAGGGPLKTPGLFEELPGRRFLTLVAGGELLEPGLLLSDELVEAGQLRCRVGCPTRLGFSLPLDATVEVSC